MEHTQVAGSTIEGKVFLVMQGVPGMESADGGLATSTNRMSTLHRAAGMKLAACASMAGAWPRRFLHSTRKRASREQSATSRQSAHSMTANGAPAGRQATAHGPARNIRYAVAGHTELAPPAEPATTGLSAAACRHVPMRR